jgi:hypothetical protein
MKAAVDFSEKDHGFRKRSRAAHVLMPFARWSRWTRRFRVPAPGGSDDLTLASKPHFLGQYRKSGFENLDDGLSGLAPRGG